MRVFIAVIAVLSFVDVWVIVYNLAFGIELPRTPGGKVSVIMTDISFMAWAIYLLATER